MKKLIIFFAFALLFSFAHSANQTASDSSKAAFYSAFDALKNMLEGKDSLNYEKTVFITENAYYGNSIDYNDFKLLLNFHIEMIKSLAERARKDNNEKYKTLKLYEQRMYKLNTDNWAIFKYLTDTTIIFHNKFVYCKMPIAYTNQDPYGSGEWKNTQIINLLGNEKGNCYALATLFKIFSDRLKSDARLVTTPHHIYIQNRNARGDFKNIELTSKTFPGDGSIQVLTYTTKTSIMNGMAQQPLNDKQAVALNLIYLAKGFQHKFNDNTNDFLLQCADLAFKHDTLSMNALLLKAEVTENRLFQQLRENIISTVAQARANPKTQKLLASYEKQLSNLYKCGYREIPKDIQHIILSAIQGNKDGYITTDKTPNPFAEFGQTTRYATLSGGLFDEMHYPVDTIQYFYVSLNTKTKKIIEFLPVDTNKNYKVDPVVFAMSVDPLTHRFPHLSPYQYANNSPIRNIDLDGAEDLPNELLNRAKTYGANLIKTATYNLINATAQSIVNLADKKIEEKKQELLKTPSTATGVLLFEFATGTGPSVRAFGPESKLSQDIIDAPKVKEAKEFFYEKNLAASEEGKPLAGVTEYRGSFGLTGLVKAGTDITEQFVGSFDLEIDVNAKEQTLTYTVKNTTSLKSALYRLAPAYERDIFGPGGNITQYFIFTEKLDPKQFDVAKQRVEERKRASSKASQIDVKR